MGGDEYVTFPRLPGGRYPAAGHPLQICDRTLACRPGNISEVLTEHYRRSHPDALGIPAG
jgi:hypothetical protein